MGFVVCQGAACDILPSGTQVATWPPPVLPPRTLATPPPFSAVDSKSPQPLTGCCHFSHGRCWDGKYIEGQASTITRLAQTQILLYWQNMKRLLMFVSKYMIAFLLFSIRSMLMNQVNLTPCSKLECVYLDRHCLLCTPSSVLTKEIFCAPSLA